LASQRGSLNRRSRWDRHRPGEDRRRSPARNRARHVRAHAGYHRVGNRCEPASSVGGGGRTNFFKTTPCTVRKLTCGTRGGIIAAYFCCATCFAH
jgi:hypothetical protein